MCLVLGIPDFISRGVQAVSKFESLVNQIHNNENDIDSKLQSMATANLLKFVVSDKSNDLPGRLMTKIIFIVPDKNIKLQTYFHSPTVTAFYLLRRQGVL